MAFNFSNIRRWQVPDSSGTYKEVLRASTPSQTLWRKFYYVRYDDNSDAQNYWTIRFDANGGTGTIPSPIDVHVGDAMTIPNVPALTKYGCTLDTTQWNTKADGTGTNYSRGSSITPSSNITLYAKWTLNKYSVSFNANGGTGSMAPYTNISYKSTFNIPTNAFTAPNGYGFSHWKTTINGHDYYYEDEDAFTMPGQNVTLTAQWSNIIWLSCCPNGGYMPDADIAAGRTAMPGISCIPGGEVLAPEPLYIRNGYSIDHPEWNTKAEKTGIDYYTNDIITMTSNLSIYVQWKANSYQITLKPNYNTTAYPGIAGTNSDTNVTVTYGSRYPTFSPVFTAIGYTFKNWYDGTTKSHFRDGYQLTDLTVEITSDRNFWAQWTPNTYTITYTLNGGTNSPNNPSTYEFGTTVEFDDATKDGYIFDGWTDINGNYIDKISPYTTPPQNVTVNATYRQSYDPDSISEFNSNDESLHGWPKGFDPTNTRYDPVPKVLKFIPGTYALTAVGCGGFGDSSSKLIDATGGWYMGYAVGGGSGAYLSGYITIPNDDYTLSILVTNVNNTKNRTCTYIKSENGALLNKVGNGKNGDSTKAGGAGGEVKNTIGMINDNTLCTINGNRGNYDSGRYWYVNPNPAAAAGGIWATVDCQYGGGAGGNGGKTYAKHYGFVHMVRIGD